MAAKNTAKPRPNRLITDRSPEAEARRPELTRKSHLKQWYGLTIEQYDEMVELQGGVCAICTQPERRVLYGNVVRLAVDHDHECCPGKRSCVRCVRGLLCHDCNTALGKMRDDPARLLRAVDYLVGLSYGS